MPAAKSGNNIVITGTGNTLESVYADIADDNFISNPASGVYYVNGNSVSRYLYINNGGELTIGSSSNPTEYQELSFVNGAANRTRFYIQQGGTLWQWGNSVVDMAGSAGAFYGQYVYLTGKCTVSGNGEYNPL